MSKRIEMSFGGLKTSNDATKVPLGNCLASSNVIADRGVLEGRKGYAKITNTNGAGWGIGYGKYTGNEIQKFIVTAGVPTSGVFTIGFTAVGGTKRTTGNVAWNCTALEFQGALEGLLNISIGDVKCTGGPFPGAPILVEFRGQYANTDVDLCTLESSTLNNSATVTISENIKGGTFEQYMVVVNTTLYKITSTDGFLTLGNTTATSVATNLTASDWYFVQFDRYIYALNATQGLQRITLGGSTTFSTTRPKAPAAAPGYSFLTTTTNNRYIELTSLATSSGFSSAPTVTFYSGGLAGVKLNATETGKAVTLTFNMTALDMQYRDAGIISLLSDSLDLVYDLASLRLEFTSNNASPVTIEPDLYFFRQQNGNTGIDAFFTLLDKQRKDRGNTNNIVKCKVYLTFGTAISGRSFKIAIKVGDNYLNDTRQIRTDVVNPATKKKIEYAYSYYKVSTDEEGDMSQGTLVDECPSDTTLGGYNYLTLRGNKDLSTSDKIYIYRREKLTGRYRRLPNADGTFGVANVTGTLATTNFSDHLMEHELASLPSAESPSGWPPSSSSGASGEQIGVWKGCLVIFGNKQCWISRKNFPNVFFPSPDEDIPLDAVTANDPAHAVTEYVSANRSEPGYGLHGQDSLYGVTNVGVYAKVGDLAPSSLPFRRLPGSRGAVGTRASTVYGGGVLVGSQDGLWYYSVGRGFNGQDNGALNEREETADVRRSWLDLLNNELQVITPTGTISGGTFTLTYSGQTTADIAYNATADAVQNALEALSNIGIGDVQVFGGPLSGGTNLYIEFRGALAATNVATITRTSSLSGGGSIAVSTAYTGGNPGSYSNLIVIEHEDEIWCIKGPRFMVSTRNRQWYEGCFNEDIKAAIANRERGLMLQETTTGQIRRVSTSYITDNDLAIGWSYTTGRLIGPRSRIVGIECVVEGAPTLYVTQDDGAGGSSTQSFALSSSRINQLSVNILPGIIHQLQFAGTVGTDKVKSCALNVEDMEEGYGS